MSAWGDAADEPSGLPELLSAYLDDELDEDEVRHAEAALLDDPALRAELVGLRRARDLVRDLPLLTVPEPFAARLARTSPLGPVARPRRRSRTRALALSVVASIAFWGAVATAGDATAVAPDLAGVVRAHSDAADSDGVHAAHPELAMTVPGSFDEFEMVYTSRRGDVVHAMYTDGERELSVFEQPGRIDWSDVPDGQFVDVAGATAWTGVVQGRPVMLLERRGMVYTLVASAPAEMDEMSEMSAAMPGDGDTWVDHVRRACRRTTDFFGLRS